LTVKAYPDRICVYFDAELIARHARSYARHQDIEDHEHAKGLIARRSRASEQRLMLRFLALSPDAQAYYDGLERKRFNARHHVRKILALAEVYPADSIAAGNDCDGAGVSMSLGAALTAAAAALTAIGQGGNPNANSSAQYTGWAASVQTAITMAKGAGDANSAKLLRSAQGACVETQKTRRARTTSPRTAPSGGTTNPATAHPTFPATISDIQPMNHSPKNIIPNA
jgi:hypothetical protein